MHFHRIFFSIAVSAVALFAQQGTQVRTGESNLSSKDRKFIQDAAKGGMEEVQLGKLASQRGESSGVKMFGQRMVTDHSKANTELEAIASKKGVDISNAKPSASMEQKLSKMQGSDFDKAYMDDMVKDHEKDISEFESEMNSNDPDLRNFVTKTLPILRSHLDEAKSVQQSLK